MGGCAWDGVWVRAGCSLGQHHHSSKCLRQRNGHGGLGLQVGQEKSHALEVSGGLQAVTEDNSRSGLASSFSTACPVWTLWEGSPSSTAPPADAAGSQCTWRLLYLYLRLDAVFLLIVIPYWLHIFICSGSNCSLLRLNNGKKEEKLRKRAEHRSCPCIARWYCQT